MQYTTSVLTGGHLLNQKQQLEKPFNESHFLGFRTNCEYLDYKELSIVKICNYKQDDDESENYEKVLLVKLKLIKILYGEEAKCREELLTVVKLSRYYMKIGQFMNAIKNCEQILDRYTEIPDIQLVSVYAILIKCNFKNGSYSNISKYYDNAIKILEFNLGADHPYQLEINEFMIEYLMANEKSFQVVEILQSSLKCISNSLGNNCLEAGEIQLKMAQQIEKLANVVNIKLSFINQDNLDTQTELQEELQMYYTKCVHYYEKSYQIFSNIKGNKLPDIALIAQKLSNINFKLNKYDKSLDLGNSALEFYLAQDQKQYIQNINDIIINRIRMLQISQKYEQAIQECDILWHVFIQNKIKDINLYQNLFKQYFLIYFVTMNQNLLVYIKEIIINYQKRIQQMLISNIKDEGDKQLLLNQILVGILCNNQTPFPFIENIFLHISQQDLVNPLLENNPYLNQNQKINDKNDYNTFLQSSTNINSNGLIFNSSNNILEGNMENKYDKNQDNQSGFKTSSQYDYVIKEMKRGNRNIIDDNQNQDKNKNIGGNDQDEEYFNNFKNFMGFLNVQDFFIENITKIEKYGLLNYE